MQNQDQGQLKIIQNVDDVKIKPKFEKNTRTIHPHALREYMKQFRSHYKLYKKNEQNQLVEVGDYYQDAVKKVWQAIGCPQNPKKLTINTSHLWHLFGGIKPDQKNQQEVKQFIINRMNAKVLELIYQKYLVEIVFGTSKISTESKVSNKFTALYYIQQFRSKLFNPLLCGCPENLKTQYLERQKNKKQPSQNADLPKKKLAKQKLIRK